MNIIQKLCQGYSLIKLHKIYIFGKNNNVLLKYTICIFYFKK